MEGAAKIVVAVVFLTGAVWNWAPVMTDVMKAVHEGTWDEYPGQDWW